MFKKLALAFFLSLIIFNNSPAVTLGASAFPEIRFPCTDTKDVEFHSLRPYQAAPCGEANKALYCSNDLIFVEEFEMAGKGDCTPRYQTGDFTCNPDYKVYPHNLYVQLDDSNLPILGNTEKVKNSQSSEDTYDDATKVNEYVSWYLNGVNTRAEYKEPTNSQVVNFSGPLQKLLPSAIAEAQRVTIIDNVDKMVSSTSGVNGSTKDDAQNHNQWVVCADKAYQLPSWLSWIPVIGTAGFGKSTAVSCYDGRNKYRIKDWRDTTSFGSIVRDLVSKYLKQTGNITAQLIDKALFDRWEKRTPPLPWSDKNGEPFKTSEAYQKAYSEWRGNLCALIPNPFGGKEILLCAGIPGITNNEYADLFPYVPLAETPDKEGAEKIDNVILSPDGGTKITAEKVGLKLTPPLYFAHTEEVKQLSETLNKTYIPKGVSNTKLPETTEENTCSVVNVRSNPGDNLFPGDSSELQVQGVEYVISEATCHETYVYVCETDPEPPHRQSCHWEDTLECPASVTITIKTSTLTPNADEIFSTTVADSASTFRKIYPKVEEGAPVSCIADMPTVTNVTYDPLIGKVPGSQKPNGGSLTFKVKNIPEDGGNVTPQLTFPHIGSVYEYFLKGIQTALRPQGFGAPTPVSADSCVSTTPVVCGELPENLPSSCGLGSVSPRIGDIPDSLRKIVEAAASTYNTPPNLILGVMYGEGVFNPGKYDWTDENVKKWATCGNMPNCSGSGGGAVGFGGNWAPIARAIAKDLKALDPNRKDPSSCNLLDLVYGISWTLHQSADGSPSFKDPSTGSGYTCLGHTLNTGIDVPSSCDWNDSQYESAIRIWEFGTGWGATSLGFYTCATKDNSCATGGGAAAQCPTDTAINPDTCKTSGNNSHNLCVWEVGHGN
jgi:hypothetical protein